MKAYLLGFAIAAIVATAACNQSGGGNESADTGSAPNAQANGTGSNASTGAIQSSDPEVVMRERHERFEAMGRATKAINQQLKGSSPDVAVIRRHAATLASYGPQLVTWFPAGTEMREGRRTRAKPEIWSDQANFRSAAQRFEQATAAFNQAAQGGDVEQIRAALPGLRDSCSNCHDRFRGPEHGEH